jgi:SAM-dependent methyltransferase
MTGAMREVENPYRVSEWNGSTAQRWVAHQSRLDAMLEPFGEAALEVASPRPGERGLDIGCGAGTSSFALGNRVGVLGRVLGLDISEALVARAGSLRDERDCRNVVFEVADAASAPFPAGEFDLLFSRFGTMFFADPVAAFTHMRRALRLDGRVVFVCWREAALNDWVRLPLGAIKGLLPPQPRPDPEAPGPFSFGDAERVKRILAQAGFREVKLAAFDSPIPFGWGESREEAVEDAVRMAFEVGPLSRALENQDDRVRQQASEAVRAAFAARPGSNSVLIEGAAWIVTARCP